VGLAKIAWAVFKRATVTSACASFAARTRQSSEVADDFADDAGVASNAVLIAQELLK